MTVHQLFDSAAGYAPVTDLFAAGDPDVRLVEGHWVMYLGAAFLGPDGAPEGVNLFSARLPAGAPLTSDAWRLDTEPHDPTRARPLLPLLGPGTFDEWRHTPCRVAGRAPGVPRPVERLYYTGTAGSSDITARTMAIGVMELVDGTWRTRRDAIVVGDHDRPAVLEPKVVFAGGRWRMWFQATHHESGPGEVPDTEIRYTESRDGLTGWSEPVVVFRGGEDDWFDAAPTPLPDGRHHLLVARAPNFFGPVDGLRPQGLWSCTASTPDGARASWSASPRRLLDAEAGPAWYSPGTYGPCAVVAPGRDGDDVLHVFFTGVADAGAAPYTMSVGRCEVALSAIAPAPSVPPVPPPPRRGSS